MRKSFFLPIAIAVGLAIGLGSGALAQWQPPDFGNAGIAIECVRLDGRCVVELAAPTTELPARVREVETRLQDVALLYRRSKRSVEPQVYSRQEDGLTNLYVRIGERETRLLTVTALDAEAQSLQIAELADRFKQDLTEDLKSSREERTSRYLRRQGRVVLAVVAIAAAVHLLLVWGVRRLHAWELHLANRRARTHEPMTTQLKHLGDVNLLRLTQQLLRLLQVGGWVGVTAYSLGLFSQSRPLQVLLLTGLQLPFRVAAVGLGTWVAARLSFVAIDRFAAALGNNNLLAPEASWRLQLRVTTISGVSKGVVGTIWCITGTLGALTAIGLNIGPILAGAGILGIAISLASQNLIRDAINGFFIILEDQYGIGDAISLNDEIGGLVENMNLRITQLRDIEGRLITIPNSEIRIVANLSSNWSRSDLKIPLSYGADANLAMAVIQTVLDDLWQDPDWQESILEPPEILGVDEFTDRGVVIRVLIKTQPLKQFPIARESRRRIKAALDAENIDLCIARERVWLERGQIDPPPDPLA